MKVKELLLTKNQWLYLKETRETNLYLPDKVIFENVDDVNIFVKDIFELDKLDQIDAEFKNDNGYKLILADLLFIDYGKVKADIARNINTYLNVLQLYPNKQSMDQLNLLDPITVIRIKLKNYYTELDIGKKKMNDITFLGV